MSLITQKVTTLAKIEGTSGVDIFAGTGDANYAVLARDVDLKCDPNVLERQFQSSSISPWKTLLGTNLYAFSFQTEFKWNGNTGGNSALPWECEPLWQAAGFATTYTPIVTTGHCNITPISTGWKTATLYFYFDGLLVKCIGSALNVDIVLEAGNLAVLNWSGFATYTRPTDVAMIASPVYDSQDGIPFRGATWTINPGGAGAKSITASKLNISPNVEIARRMSATATWGVAGFQITKRNLTGSFDPETTVEADATSIPWWQTFDANTLCALQCNFGDTNGNQVEIAMPKVTLDSNAFADRDGLRSYEVPFHAGRNSADDEININCT